MSKVNYYIVVVEMLTVDIHTNNEKTTYIYSVRTLIKTIDNSKFKTDRISVRIAVRWKIYFHFLQEH